MFFASRSGTFGLRWSSGSGVRPACRSSRFSRSPPAIGRWSPLARRGRHSWPCSGRRRGRPQRPYPREPSSWGFTSVSARSCRRSRRGDWLTGGVSLTAAAASSVWLDGYRLEVPGSDDVDAFVAKLVRLGLLVQDPIIGAAVGSDLSGVSVRSIERRVSRATGLIGHGLVDQLHLFMYPLVLGDGARLFDDGLDLKLSLITTEATTTAACTWPTVPTSSRPVATSDDRTDARPTRPETAVLQLASRSVASEDRAS